MPTYPLATFLKKDIHEVVLKGLYPIFPYSLAALVGKDVGSTVSKTPSLNSMLLLYWAGHGTLGNRNRMGGKDKNIIKRSLLYPILRKWVLLVWFGSVLKSQILVWNCSLLPIKLWTKGV